MKCPECDTKLTVIYDAPKYIEFELDHVEPDGSIIYGEMIEFDLGGTAPYFYCNNGHGSIGADELGIEGN